MRVCLGGTFSPFHNGHKELLKKAFELAGPTGVVYVGVTSDTMAEHKGNIPSVEKRCKEVNRFIKEKKFKCTHTVQCINDSFGPTLQGNYDTIVVSPETRPTAEEINRRRKQAGNKPLDIVVIPFVLADDNKPISSTRIRKKEINEKGKAMKKE